MLTIKVNFPIGMKTGFIRLSRSFSRTQLKTADTVSCDSWGEFLIITTSLFVICISISSLLKYEREILVGFVFLVLMGC